MTRDVYSVRLAAGGGLTPATGPIGPIVPAGVVWVVRDVDVVESSGLRPAGFEMYNQELGLLFFVLMTTSTPSANFSWRGRQVYAEGEQIRIQATQGTWDFAISGYQLTLP